MLDETSGNHYSLKTRNHLPQTLVNAETKTHMATGISGERKGFRVFPVARVPICRGQE